MHAGGFEVTSGSQARERQGDQGHGREGSCSPPCCTTSTSNSNNSNWWACLSSRSTARTNIHQMSNLGAVKVLCLGVRGDNKRCCLVSWRSEFSNCRLKLRKSGGGSAHCQTRRRRAKIFSTTSSVQLHLLLYFRHLIHAFPLHNGRQDVQKHRG